MLDMFAIPDVQEPQNNSRPNESVNNVYIQKILKDIPFVIGFMVLVLGINMTFGDKATVYFLILVLLSMLVTNSYKVNKFFNQIKRG